MESSGSVHGCSGIADSVDVGAEGKGCVWEWCLSVLLVHVDEYLLRDSVHWEIVREDKFEEDVAVTQDEHRAWAESQMEKQEPKTSMNEGHFSAITARW